MKIIKASQYKQTKPSIITIGTFDGVHIGHQKIIQRLVDRAKNETLQALVLTFFPHPRLVVQKDDSIKLINTIDEKAIRLESHGVDAMVVQAFTKSFSRLTALEYVRDVLVNKLNVKHIIVGYDHQFGRNRTANISDLKEFGDFYGFEVTEIGPQEVNEVTVSSTKIRSALLSGKVEVANAYLGYQFPITGTVIRGKGLGHQMGFPTANILVEEPYKLIPKDGVYLIQSSIGKKQWYGMMNIGKNPTVSTGQQTNIEVHFFEYSGDLYHKTLQVQLLSYIRQEIKFPNIKALKAQLKKDKEKAQDLIDLLSKT